jgi:hypothetical protein
MDVDATPVPADPDVTPIPGVPILTKPNTPPPDLDPEATANNEFLFGDFKGSRREVLSQNALLARLDVLIRSHEGCEKVTALEVYPLDKVDRRDGCNWSLALMLDPAGVAPEIYAVGYAQAIAMARASWNLKEGPQDESSGPESKPDLVVG